MNKILWLSDGAQIPTGYSTISRKLMNCLVDYGWEGHYLSHTNGISQTFLPGTKLEDGEEFKFHMHGGGMQPYAMDRIMPKIQEIKPKIFAVLLDTFMLFPAILNLDFAPAKSLFYFPSDGGGGLDSNGNLIRGLGCRMPLNCESILRKFDYQVAMSRYAQKQVKEIHGLDTHYIPHAIETDNYKPLSYTERMLLRRKYGFNEQQFIVGVVARNQGRKMLDRTLISFQKVAKQIPDAILLLHSDKYDPATYFNMDVLMAELGITNRVFFTGTNYIKGFNYKQMNEVYNLFDVFFLGTSGEGFGIPIIESMACEIPVITTDYTTGWELVGRNNCGELIKVKEEIMGSWNVGRACIDTDDAAEKIIKLYNSPALRQIYGKNGREAVLREYCWKIVSKQWNDYLRSLI